MRANGDQRFQGLEIAPAPRLALSIAQAAEALGVSENTVKTAMRAGLFRCVRIGERVLLPVDELRRGLTENVTDYKPARRSAGETRCKEADQHEDGSTNENAGLPASSAGPDGSH